MSRQVRKCEVVIPKAEAETFFRTLGQGLSSGSLSLGGTCMELGEFRSLRVLIKDQGGAYQVKLRVKQPKDGMGNFEPSFFSDDDDDDDDDEDQALAPAGRESQHAAAAKLDSAGEECHSRRR